MAEEKIIGIDLGTTNSVVAVMEGNEVKVIPNQEGNRLTPSVVAYTGKGEVLVGDPAKRQAVTNSKRTISSIKRFMGRRFDEVQEEIKLVPYEVVRGPNDLAVVKVGGKTYTPPEISALILRKLKEAAESYLGQPRCHAFVTGHRSHGGRADRADPTKHHHSDDEERTLLNGGGQPIGRDDPRLPGRESDRQQSVQPAPSPVQPGGHPAGAARCALGQSCSSTFNHRGESAGLNCSVQTGGDAAWSIHGRPPQPGLRRKRWPCSTTPTER
jgi:hypothetical protein